MIFFNASRSTSSLWPGPWETVSCSVQNETLLEINKIGGYTRILASQTGMRGNISFSPKYIFIEKIENFQEKLFWRLVGTDDDWSKQAEEDEGTMSWEQTIA